MIPIISRRKLLIARQRMVAIPIVASSSRRVTIPAPAARSETIWISRRNIQKRIKHFRFISILRHFAHRQKILHGENSNYMNVFELLKVNLKRK